MGHDTRLTFGNSNTLFLFLVAGLVHRSQPWPACASETHGRTLLGTLCRREIEGERPGCLCLFVSSDHVLDLHVFVAAEVDDLLLQFKTVLIACIKRRPSRRQSRRLKQPRLFPPPLSVLSVTAKLPFLLLLLPTPKHSSSYLVHHNRATRFYALFPSRFITFLARTIHIASPSPMLYYSLHHRSFSERVPVLGNALSFPHGHSSHVSH
jgi:hypothetical protein